MKRDIDPIIAAFARAFRPANGARRAGYGAARLRKWPSKRGPMRSHLVLSSGNRALRTQNFADLTKVHAEVGSGPFPVFQLSRNRTSR